MKIFLDAGHGGKDTGAINDSRYEKNDNLAMCKAVGAYLQGAGVQVGYSRTTDRYDTPASKAYKANVFGADYFVSFHRNGAEVGASGFEVLVTGETSKAYRIATTIVKAMEGKGFKNRGVKFNPRLTVLKNTRMPAVLIETGFITNDGDNALYDTHANEYAYIIGDAIMQAVGWHTATPATPATPTPTASTEFKVRVTGTGVRIRTGAGVNNPIAQNPSEVKQNEVYTITEVAQSGGLQWGHLKSGAGWIALKFTERV